MNTIYGFQANVSVHGNLVKWFSPSLPKNIINAIWSTFPILNTVYKPSFFPSQLTQWFYDIAHEAIRYRLQNPTNRSDFLNFLLERKQVNNYSEKDLGAFAAIFLFNGFETTSMILTQALYYIAKHEQYQMKLRTEIVEYFRKCPTVDTINELQYLDNIVNGMVV